MNLKVNNILFGVVFVLLFNVASSQTPLFKEFRRNIVKEIHGATAFTDSLRKDNYCVYKLDSSYWVRAYFYRPVDVPYDIAYGPSGVLSITPENQGVFVKSNGYWQGYNTENSEIISDSVRSLFYAQDSVLWYITHQGGVGSFDGEKWSQYPAVKRPPVVNDAYQFMHFFEHKGRLFLSTKMAFYEWKNKVWVKITIANLNDNNHILSTDVDTSGNLWVVRRDYAGILDVDSYSFTLKGRSGWLDIDQSTSGSSASARFTDMCMDSAGNMLFTTNHGLFKYMGGNYRPIMPATNNYDRIVSIGNGTIYLSDGRSVYHMPTPTLHVIPSYYSHSRSLIATDVDFIKKDPVTGVGILAKRFEQSSGEDYTFCLLDKNRGNLFPYGREQRTLSSFAGYLVSSDSSLFVLENQTSSYTSGYTSKVVELNSNDSVIQVVNAPFQPYKTIVDEYLGMRNNDIIRYKMGLGVFETTLSKSEQERNVRTKDKLSEFSYQVTDSVIFEHNIVNCRLRIGTTVKYYRLKPDFIFNTEWRLKTVWYDNKLWVNATHKLSSVSEKFAIIDPNVDTISYLNVPWPCKSKYQQWPYCGPINAMATFDDKLYATGGIDSKLYSYIRGTWDTITTGLLNSQIFNLASYGDSLLAVSSDSGLFVLAKNGRITRFNPIEHGSYSASITSKALLGPDVVYVQGPPYLFEIRKNKTYKITDMPKMSLNSYSSTYGGIGFDNGIVVSIRNGKLNQLEIIGGTKEENFDYLIKYGENLLLTSVKNAIVTTSENGEVKYGVRDVLGQRYINFGYKVYNPPLEFKKYEPGAMFPLVNKSGGLMFQYVQGALFNYKLGDSDLSNKKISGSEVREVTKGFESFWHFFQTDSRDSVKLFRATPGNSVGLKFTMPVKWGVYKYLEVGTDDNLVMVGENGERVQVIYTNSKTSLNYDFLLDTGEVILTRNLFRDSEGSIWLGTSKRFLCFKDSTWYYVYSKHLHDLDLGIPKSSMQEAKVIGNSMYINKWNSYDNHLIVKVNLDSLLFVRYDDSAFVVSGHVFGDVNDDSVFNSSELPLFGVRVTLLPDSISTLSNADGSYTFRLPEKSSRYGDSIKVLCETTPKFKKINPNHRKYLLLNSLDSVNFGVVKYNDVDSVEVWGYSLRYRCGKYATQSVLLYNRSQTTFEDDTLMVKLDSKTLAVHASPVWTKINADSTEIKFAVSSFRPGDKLTFNVGIGLKNGFVLGDTITQHFVWLHDSINVQDSSSNIVTCSFDPNAKEVSPLGYTDSSFVKVGSEFTYTIYFQNTGNDTAYDVRIRDTLSNFLDVNTMRVIASSHRMFTEIKEGQIVDFIFPNIDLLDSFSNEPESHGYVVYKIKAVEGIENRSEISNKAFIYFDENEPIETNQTLSTIWYNTRKDTSSDSTNLVLNVARSNPFVIFPNPTHQYLNIHSQNLEPFSWYIRNQNGQEVLSGQGVLNEQIDVRSLSSSVYLIELRQEGELVQFKWVRL